MAVFSKYFDHTVLKAEAKSTDIQELCREAIKNDFFSVCVNGAYVPLAKQLLMNSEIKISAVVGFPLGAMTSYAKAFEADDACQNGADEIDMVMNIGQLKSMNYDYVAADIKTVVDMAKNHAAVVKVIIETCLLSNFEIEQACLIAMESGADYIKTSTGFSTAGASPEQIKLIRETVGDMIKIKASGGIKTLEEAEKMIAAGADRIGSSASIEIIEEYNNTASGN
ncbi:MAG: deoxyribose-phosphate aldolase [Anaerovoracaceae bacterium]